MGIGGRLTAVLHVVQRFWYLDCVAGYDLLVTLLRKRAAQYLMSGKKASQSLRSEEEARSLTLLQLNKSVRCTKGFHVSVRCGECLVHGVFPLSARNTRGRGSGSGVRNT